MFFLYLDRRMEIFSCKYSTFLEQIATTLLQRTFTNIANEQGIPSVRFCWLLGTVL